MMRTRLSICALVVFIAQAMPAYADSIVVDGVTHEDVVIRESDSRYYVQDPADGSVFVVSKDAVKPDDVSIGASDEDRDQMHRSWRLQRGLSDKTEFELQLETSRRAFGYPDAAVIGAEPVQEVRRAPVVIRRDGERTDGRVRNIKLDNVPVSAALDATLRPVGLDYRVEENYVNVSSRERLRRERQGQLETRVFGYTDLNATLPKIVVQNPSGAGASHGGGGGGGFSGGGGGGGFSGGGGGGFTGGGGGGRGGAGGGRGRSTGGTQQFSNISQLFSTIDDRRVGETPAQIGLGISGTGRTFVRR